VPTYTSIESRLLHKICEARLPLEHGLSRLFAGLISCAPANPEFATRKGANHRAVTAIVISLSLAQKCTTPEISIVTEEFSGLRFGISQQIAYFGGGLPKKLLSRRLVMACATYTGL
jgi:hypothetical protein